jgi:uncharacterized protein (UPF0264 family)
LSELWSRVSLAGSLRPERIAELAELRPDFIAVRAVCEGGTRQGRVDARRVQR